MKSRMVLLISLCLLAFGVQSRADSAAPAIFHTYQTRDGLSHNKVWCAAQDSRGFIWFGTENGLTCYEGSSSRTYYHNAADPLTIGDDCIHALLSDGDNLWIGTPSGVFIYHNGSDSFEQFTVKTKYSVRISCDVRRIIKHTDGSIWIATLGQGIFIYTPSDGQLRQLNGQKTLILDIREKASGTVWATAVYSDVLTYSAGGDFLGYQGHASDGSLWQVDDEVVKSLDGVNGVMLDKENTLWVLTSDAGACYLPSASRAMKYYSLAAGAESSRVNCFVESSDGVILVGSENGVWAFDPSLGHLSKYSNIRHVTALAFVNGQLWAGTSGNGLYRLDRSGRVVRNYRYTSGRLGSLPSDDILCISQLKNGQLMIGTAFGLYSYMPEFDSFSPRLGVGSMSSVNNVFEDVDGRMWVSTLANGQCINELATSSWTNIGSVYNGETSMTIGAVLSGLVASDGRVWLGLDGKGLCTYNKENNRLEIVSSLGEDLRKEAVYCLAEDRQGNIWMALESRLAVISTSGALRTYDSSDVLRTSKFTGRASLRTSDGNLLFGDASGFYCFSPEKIAVNSYAPPVYITSYEVLDKTFTASIAVLSYVAPYKNKCRYRLAGYDSDWITAAPGLVEYRNLSPGNYRFEVYGINEDGVESSEPAVYSFTIARPFWASNLAIFMYLLVFVGIVFVVMLMWNRHLAEVYRKRAEEQALAREQEAAQSKIRFFVSLVHEIRTPLSLIVLPLEKLRESVGSDDKNLRIIDKNVDYLLNVANQLLDFKTMDCDFVPLPKLMEDVREIVSDGEPAQATTRDESFTVLVVDDNPALVDFEAASLSQWYKVEKAMSGEEALKVLSEKEINLVVSDVMMPGISGVELCRAIVADINTSHIPVLLLTAKVDLGSKVEGLEAGAVAYIEKPFTIKQLHLQIDNIKSIRRDFGSRAVLNDFAAHTGLNPSDYAFLTQQDLDFIRRVNTIIEERAKIDGCSVDKVAEMVGMSSRNFNRKMNTIFSMTPNKYILKYKMHIAKRMLDEGNRPGEVAAVLNFSTTSYFAKCYKDEFGVNPKEYQRR